MKPSFSVIIPARYASSRFPGKPLYSLAGMTMIERVAQQALQAGAERVIVATDDERIAAPFTGTQIMVAMTRATHQSGTDRVYEAALLAGLVESDVIVNVQGDEPLIPPAVIRQAATLVDRDWQVATLYEPMASAEEVGSPNAVKVVVGAAGEALYFSRAPIPVLRQDVSLSAAEGRRALASGLYKRHVGIYAYTMAMLSRFVSYSVAPLEEAEQLEQLRLLSNGFRIRIAAACESVPAGVDTPVDAQRVEALLDA